MSVKKEFQYERRGNPAHSKYKYYNIYIILCPIFAHRKKLMTLMTHDTYDTQKKFLKKLVIYS